MKKKIILSINTSNEYCSIAIKKDNKIHQITTIKKNKHLEKILKLIDVILLKNKLKLKDIKIILFNSGPGNSISLRIGYCVTKILSMILKIKIIYISNIILKIQKIKNNKKKKILCAINSKKNNFFLYKYYIFKKKIIEKFNINKTINIKEVKNIIKKNHSKYIYIGEI